VTENGCQACPLAAVEVVDGAELCETCAREAKRLRRVELTEPRFTPTYRALEEVCS
jgi:hypothetical protein